jgi:Na+/melibiose symporter-like transporter
MTDTETTTPEERALKRSKDFTGMLWHIATFVIINAFLWTIDILGGDGVNWAFWVTITWGIALAFHVAWYFIDVSREGRRYEKFLEDERKKDAA